MQGRGGRTLVGLVGCLVTLACGGVTDDDGSGGAPGSGGNSAGGTESGGADSGGTNAGGTDSGGSSTGGASTGGTGGSGGQAAGGTQGTEGCPPAPTERLFPVIGPFWLGPDPGPCSSAPESATYSYVDGLLESSTASGGETYVRDQQNRIVEVISASDPATYSYADGTVHEVRSTHEVFYTLSTTGYPLQADVIQNGVAEPVVYTYTYADCRLALRAGPSTRTYEYDDAGHVVAIMDAGSTTTFDYGCW